MLEDIFHFCSFNLTLLGEKIKAKFFFAEAHVSVCWRQCNLMHRGALLTRCQPDQVLPERRVCTGQYSEIHLVSMKLLLSNDSLGLCAQYSRCNKLSLRCRICSTNSILLSSVFIQLLPDLSSAYCPGCPVGLLSLEHASGRGLLLIGHQPSVPTGGGDQMLCQNSWSAKIIWLCLSSTHSHSLITLWIDSRTDLSSQKKQNHVWLTEISERQVCGVVRRMSRNAVLPYNEYKLANITFFMIQLIYAITSVRDLSKWYTLIQTQSLWSVLAAARS